MEEDEWLELTSLVYLLALLFKMEAQRVMHCAPSTKGIRIRTQLRQEFVAIQQPSIESRISRLFSDTPILYKVSNFN